MIKEILIEGIREEKNNKKRKSDLFSWLSLYTAYLSPKKDTRLGQGLVFDDEIAAQQRMRPDAHPMQFRKQRGSETAGNLGEALGAISGKRRSEQAG